MSLVSFELDTAGIAEVLKSAPMRDLVNGLAVQVAANVRSSLPERDARVEFRPYTTDRQGATVVVLHRKATEWQAETKFLTRAAAAAGLEVNEKPVPQS